MERADIINLLRSNFDFPAWAETWLEITVENEQDEVLLELGKAWASWKGLAVPEAYWAAIFKRIQKNPAGEFHKDVRLTEVATAVFNSEVQRADNCLVAFNYLVRVSLVVDLKKLAFDKIITFEEPPPLKTPELLLWRVLFRYLTSGQIFNETVLDIGFSFARHFRVKPRIWRDIFLRLLERVPEDARIPEEAIAGLQAIQHAPRHWVEVWYSLRRARALREEILLDMALDWLRHGSPPIGNSWVQLWSDIEKMFPGDEGLLSVGWMWLKRATVHFAAWPTIWAQMYEILPRDPELIALGRRWLASGGHSSYVQSAIARFDDERVSR